MSDLVVVGFKDEMKADEVLNKLGKLQKSHLIALEDAAVLIKDENGKVRIKQAFNLIAAGASSGSFWGALLGLLFLQPLIGLAAGAATGAIGGALSDIGINDDFIKDLGKTIEPGSSALFILVRDATPDKVIEELKPFDGKILSTSLSKTDEDSLKAALEKAQSAAA